MRLQMKYVDYVCAWAIFAMGIVGVLVTEIRHPVHAVLDTPILWILVAMFNLLRLQNGYGVKSLKIFCIGANVAVVALESVRFKMFGPLGLVVALPIACEAIFSIVRSNSSEARGLLA